MSRKKTIVREREIYHQYFREQIRRHIWWIYVFGPLVNGQYDCLVFDKEDIQTLVPRVVFASQLTEPVAESLAPSALKSAVARHFKNAFDPKRRN